MDDIMVSYIAYISGVTGQQTKWTPILHIRLYEYEDMEH